MPGYPDQQDLHPLMLLLLAFILGAVVGSFLNVCIVRLPRDESIVAPRSHCRSCGALVRAIDNIPLLSFLLLRGRCRKCGVAISWRYPLVELCTALLFVLLAWRLPLGPLLFSQALFASALVAITFIDIEHQIIPDRISLPGVVVGLLIAAAGFGPPFWDSLVGALLGGGLLYAVAFGYQAMTGTEGMGGGDIKLLAMIGAFLGWKAVLITILLGSFSGSIVGTVLIVMQRQDSRVPIAFGPFLAGGALFAMLFGNDFVDWYLRYVSGG